MATSFKKVENLIRTLNAITIDDQHDLDSYSKRVGECLRSLNAAWSNDAVAGEAARLKNALNDAWDAATGHIAESL